MQNLAVSQADRYLLVSHCLQMHFLLVNATIKVYRALVKLILIVSTLKFKHFLELSRQELL